jgi:C-terminal peptidase prc
MRTSLTHSFYFATTLVVVATPELSRTQPVGAGTPIARFADSSTVRDSALRLIYNYYFESAKIDSSLPIKEIVSRLDPFSWYETSAGYARFMRGMNDQELRYGIQLRSVLGHVILTTVIIGSVADHAGLLPGDELLAAGGYTLFGDDGFANSLLRNWDTATLRLHRTSPDSTWSVALEKARCASSSVPVVTMIDSQVGYVSVTGFHNETAEKLQKAVDRLLLRGMRALVIDLRGNRGGLVHECLQAANLFVHSPDTIMRENSRVAAYVRQHSLVDDALYPTLPLALLVDNASCSAAEMFSGILQDLDRAVVVGQPTTGKSLVMRFFELPNSEKLYLATAYYTLPSGRSVQRPYQNDKFIGGDYRDFESCDNSHHTIDSDLAEAQCPTFKTATGRNMIPFAGIIPDYIVSHAVFYPDWLRDAVEGAAALYLQRNADWLINTTTIDSFDHHCQLPVKLIEWTLDTIRAHDTTAKKLLSAQLAWMVPKLIKANVAYSIWGARGFFLLWERNSGTVRRAAELVSKPPSLAVLEKH